MTGGIHITTKYDHHQYKLIRFYAEHIDIIKPSGAT